MKHYHLLTNSEKAIKISKMKNQIKDLQESIRQMDSFIDDLSAKQHPIGQTVYYFLEQMICKVEVYSYYNSSYTDVKIKEILYQSGNDFRVNDTVTAFNPYLFEESPK